MHVFLRRRELQEVQALYRQSSEHAAEQAQLIQQLEGLNLDTQRVLRNQEEAHTADTTSYQKVTNYTIYYHSIHLHYNTHSPLQPGRGSHSRHHLLLAISNNTVLIHSTHSTQY